MPPDIEDFVQTLVADAASQDFAYLTLSSEAALVETERFRAAFRRDLPTTHVEVCRLADGFTTDNMARLHGLQTIWSVDEEFPDHEGVIEIHEAQMLDGIGRDDFIEFGNQDGVEPWGWDLALNCFIRSDPNMRGVMSRFYTFEDMFRALFQL